MKKFVALTLILGLCTVLFACISVENTGTDTKTTTSSAESQSTTLSDSSSTTTGSQTVTVTTTTTTTATQNSDNLWGEMGGSEGGDSNWTPRF